MIMIFKINMQTIKFSFLVMLVMQLCFTFVSCGKDNDKEDSSYTSSLSEIILKDLEFGPEHGKQSIFFPNQNMAKWTITSDAAWCSPWIDNDNHAIIVEVVARGEAEPNPGQSRTTRSCIVKITDSKGTSRTFKVFQMP